MNIISRLTAKLLSAPSTLTVKHYRGYPSELTGGREERELSGTPDRLAIEVRPDGVFLIRFDVNGKIVGDTWHATIEEAKEQANFEFGEFLGEWKSA